MLKRSILLISTTIIAALILSACGSSHDHGPTPAGLNLLIDGEVVATQEGTNVTYAIGNSIEMVSGQSADIEIEWFLESGETYDYTEDDGYSLRYNVMDDSVINVSHPAQGNEWMFTASAESGGSTEMNFELWHVDHSDFDSRNFAFTVSGP